MAPHSQREPGRPEGKNGGAVLWELYALQSTCSNVFNTLRNHTIERAHRTNIDDHITSFRSFRDLRKIFACKPVDLENYFLS